MSTTSIQTLANQLAERLWTAYDRNGSVGHAGGQPLRDAFAEFLLSSDKAEQRELVFERVQLQATR